MKKIEAIVEPSKLHEVQIALGDLGINVMTVTEVKGSGRQEGHLEIYRGREYTVNFLPKMKLELVLHDSELDEAVAAITRSDQSGKSSCRNICVFNLEQATRSRGE